MLNQIHIQGLATIDSAQIELINGCMMITGETGAGKSIFIEAIELGLGARASQKLIRPGTEKADISLCFDITRFPHVINYLKKLDLYEDNDECIIRRVITADGRSRCYVNGLPSTLQLAKELGDLLFHLHSQNEQQVLLKTDTQRDMLDRFAEHLPLINNIKNIANEIKDINSQINNIETKSRERTERCEYLRFQLEELLALSLKENEWNVLETEHHRLSHSEELIKQLQCALSIISNNENTDVLSQLNECRKAIEPVQSVEIKTQEWLETLQNVSLQIDDLHSELQFYIENTDLDPEKLQTVESRVSQIFSLARKHKVEPDALYELTSQLKEELSILESSDETLTTLKKTKQALEIEYGQEAKRLTKSRQKAASKLEKEITKTIRSLSLPHGEFHISLAENAMPFSPYGAEKINFLIKTNPDQHLQPLAKVISGGELSRLSLAAHLSLANKTNIPTLIFDEIDTGLSGATAEKIGRLLQKLGETYQVFCVTHQAQVACCGHNHLLVEKEFINNKTHTSMRVLNNNERTNEIARMLGGEKITTKTLDHAKEMLEL